jgi:electron transport complex protein RnfA
MDALSPFALIIGAIFVNNVVLAQFLGICPFLGVSKDVKSSLGMGGAVLFVMLLATLVTYLIYKYLLLPFDLVYLQTIAYILVISGLVQMIKIVLKKIAPALYQTLGVFLPLITTNCAVLGVAILVIQKDMNLLQSIIYAGSIAIGFTLALVIFAGIREQMELTGVPKGMKGVPIALVTAGILAMAFMGFGGIVPTP